MDFRKISHYFMPGDIVKLVEPVDLKLNDSLLRIDAGLTAKIISCKSDPGDDMMLYKIKCIGEDEFHILKPEIEKAEYVDADFVKREEYRPLLRYTQVEYTSPLLMTLEH